ncbi:peptidoglycan-binding protein [Loktanella sp. 5RATIMAR09]|uniref:holin-associated N-acetylmuramidase n=1 Tax=Loktanella sp. 5RATIMAR09 TaxID=1225655 RepID=UPI0006EB826E|nr:holin-associated N-acetylmuramidase [Loktanella sp. 5RATIMAR09]KQI73317.1 peptidoglycan-binding protein [Loktanella sp. 5RATIMAR09]
MPTVTEIATDIVNREGGYVNDPDDPGGPTNFGVTVHTMRRLGLDLTKDGQIDSSDVRVLTSAHAVSIFVEHYFRGPRIDRLPAPLQASVFDLYVNAGANAVKILQRLLCDMRIVVTVDGVIGPKTVAAARQAMEAAPDHLVDAYGIARRNYYYDLADRRPASRKYAMRSDGGKGGWIKRAEEFIAARYHLTEAQHQARVAQWV